MYLPAVKLCLPTGRCTLSHPRIRFKLGLKPIRIGAGVHAGVGAGVVFVRVGVGVWLALRRQAMDLPPRLGGAASSRCLASRVCARRCLGGLRACG